MFTKFSTSQCAAQRSNKLISASNSETSKATDPYPFEIHQNSPFNLAEVQIGSRGNFLKSHPAFAKVQPIKR